MAEEQHKSPLLLPASPEHVHKADKSGTASSEYTTKLQTDTRKL